MTTNTTTETLIEALRNAIDGGDAPMHRDYETMRDAMIVSILPVIQAHQPDSDALLRDDLIEHLVESGRAKKCSLNTEQRSAADDEARSFYRGVLTRIDAFLATPTAPTGDAGEFREPCNCPDNGKDGHHPLCWDADRTQPDAAAPSDAGALARFHELLGSFGLVLTDDPDFDHDDETFGKAQHALLAALKQPSNSAREWRPIETAPKPAALRASTGTEGEGEDV